MNSPLETLPDGPYDLLVVGGGISGSTAAREFSRAGYRVAVVEHRDFGSGSSGDGPELFDGALRRLAEGRIRGVLGARHARQSLLRAASHLVRPCPFLVAEELDSGWSRTRPMLALSEYLSRPLDGWPAPRSISPADAQTLLPGSVLVGGDRVAVHYEAVIDTRRLALFTALDARRSGARLLNRCALVSVESAGPSLARVIIRDQLTGDLSPLLVRMILSAAGAGIDALRRALGQLESGDLLNLRTSQRAFFARPADAGALFRDPRSGQLRFLLPAPGGLILRESSDDRAEVLEKTLFPERPGAALRQTVSEVCSPPSRSRPLPGGWWHGESLEGIPLVHFACHSLAAHHNAAHALRVAVGRLLGPPEDAKTNLAPTLPGADLDSVDGEVAAARGLGLTPSQARRLVERYGNLWRSVVQLAEDPPAAGEWGVPLLAEVDWEVDQGAVRTLSDLCSRLEVCQIARGDESSLVDSIARRMAARLDWSPARREREITRWRKERAERYLA